MGSAPLNDPNSSNGIDPAPVSSAAPQDEGQPVSPVSAFLTALQFLLISPAFIRRPFTPQELGAAVGYYPVIGLLLGGILLAGAGLLNLVFPPLVSAALLLVLWIGLTGALHLDGFLDTCDGLLGGFNPAQRLEIMRDERIGAFAFAGGALLLIIKFSSLAALGVHPPALLLAPTLSRWSMALALVGFPYARPHGLGRDIKENAPKKQALRATIFTLALVCALALWSESPIAFIAWIGAAAALGLGIRFTLTCLPGLTGDIYGALNELVEVMVLLVYTAF